MFPTCIDPYLILSQILDILISALGVCDPEDSDVGQMPNNNTNDSNSNNNCH